MNRSVVSHLSLLKQISDSRQPLCQRCRTRSFTTTHLRPSGHNKWSTIKHDKARNDAIKNRQRTTLSHAIANASKQHGSDPKSNVQLATAIANARKAGMHKETIEAAVMRGQGRSATGAALEDLTIEAMVPPVSLIVECQTESKGKALSELRTLLKNYGATATSTSFLFERRGRILFSAQEGVDVEELLEAALETDALDVNSTEEGHLVVDTQPQDLKAIETKMLEKTGLETDSLGTVWTANTDTAVRDLDPATLDGLSNLTKSLEEYPGVQAVYTNFKAE